MNNANNRSTVRDHFGEFINHPIIAKSDLNDAF